MLPKIFAGISVLDFSRLLPGPFASGLLAKMGAEINCIVPPQKDAILGDYSPFTSLREGKSFHALDLKSPEGLVAAKERLKASSILLEGFRPGTMDRLGLGFEAAKAVQPNILYVSLVGYPRDHRKYLAGGHDLNFLIDSGIYRLLYGESSEALPDIQIADVIGGFYAAFRILTAWIDLLKNPGPRFLEVSVVEGLSLMREYLQDGTAAELLPLLTGGLARYRIYKTQDGKSVAVAGLEPKFHAALLDTLKLEPRVGESETDLASRIQQAFSGKEAREWEMLFREVDACVSFF